jgi:hypothetical protein
MLAAAIVGDALTHTARLYLQYCAAERAAVVDARTLADICQRYDGNFRVVAHSLGCRLVIEALPLLPPAQRPREVHLCAAASTAEHVLPRLEQLCAPSGRVVHYYSPSDEVLITGFRLMTGVPAFGAGPLGHSIAGVTEVDATNYCGMQVHDSYAPCFHRLALDAAVGAPPPPAQGVWLERQRVQLRDALALGVGKLQASMPTGTGFFGTQAASASFGAMERWMRQGQRELRRRWVRRDVAAVPDRET